MENTSIVPLPVQITQKLLSSIKTQKTGKNDDEKSFNRYVRQLVDQYLDKEVVISKQPEDKVELIVQACRERFPEYAHWTTTRIRIYIESCRRLKKIKNSPILLAKRKAAGRKFREGQKLKKMITSQLSIQAAEYILKSNGVAVKEEPVSMLETISKCDDRDIARDTTSIHQFKDQGEESMPTSTTPPSLGLNNIMHFAPQLLSTASPPTAITQLLSTSPLIQTPATSLCNGSKPQVSIPAFCMSPYTATTATSTVSAIQSTRSSAFSSPLLSTSTNQSAIKSSSPDRNGCISPLRPKIELPSTISPVLSDNNVSSTSLQSKLNTMAVKDSPKRKSFHIDNLINNQVEETVTSILENNLTSDEDPGDMDLEEKSMRDNEILNTKTLVTSYREAANFLYRAATELEQMLPPEHQVF